MILASALLGSRLLAQQPPASSAPPAKPAPAAPAQSEPERSLPGVTESVDVSVTSVEVVVTDSKGNRVPDLTAEDFEIKQDGVSQKITNFYAVSGGKVLLEDGTTVPLDAPATPDAEVPRELKAYYIFYIDNLNIQPNNRNRMFKRLKNSSRRRSGLTPRAWWSPTTARSVRRPSPPTPTTSSPPSRTSS
jgi:hypothetical protein